MIQRENQPYLELARRGRVALARDIGGFIGMIAFENGSRVAGGIRVARRGRHERTRNRRIERESERNRSQRASRGKSTLTRAVEFDHRNKPSSADAPMLARRFR